MTSIFENKFRWSIGDVVTIKSDDGEVNTGTIVNRQILETIMSVVLTYGVNLNEIDIYDEFSESELDDG